MRNNLHIRLVRKDVMFSIRSGRYAIIENSRLNSNEERMMNTIHFFFSIGVTRISVNYDIGYDREGFGYEHPYDLITPETSEEELHEILTRAIENPCSVGTSITVNEETIGIALFTNGEFNCNGRHILNEGPKADLYNNSETVWNLEEYFNSFAG